MIAVALMVPIACNAPEPNVAVQFLEFEGSTMGTTYSVRIARPPQRFVDVPNDLALVIEEELEHVNNHMSTYRPDSELSRFNASVDVSPFAISEDTARVFALALEVSEQSNGAFDVTVGPLVNAWGFGPDGHPENPLANEEIEQLMDRVGYSKLNLDLENGTVTKKIPELYCDLSAIAKGWASERIASALVDEGCMEYMVEVGGEMQAKGLNPDEVPWRIAIETPAEGRREVFAIAGLIDVGMATSGDYRNFYDVDGVRLSHTIDPRTGRPVAHNLGSVSVVHESCALADAYATALMVMGADEGFTWATENDLAAFFITRDAEGALQYKATEAFAPYLAEVIDPS
jgi:thiamine biosynthesis lipoprotein